MSKIETLTLTKRNISPDRKNVMTLRFKTPMRLTADSEISLLSCYIPYSWKNITTAYNNRSVSYYWPPDDSTNLITFDEFFFLTSDISNYIQLQMLKNGHYLVDENGSNVFYFSIENNYTVYGNTATFTPLPPALPEGWSNPGGVDLSVPHARTPQLVIGSNNWGLLVGFEKNTSYPATPSSSVVQINSPVEPQITLANQCLIGTNMVYSPNYNTFGNIIASFAPDVKFGSQITVEPTRDIWYRCIGQDYDYLEIAFYDSEQVPLAINDTNILVSVRIKK